MTRGEDPEQMKFRAPYFPFYVNDFAADAKVEAMSTSEAGAYIFLLCKAWMEDPPGTLPDDDRNLAKWSRLTMNKWKESKVYVMAPFTLEPDGRWHQKRMKEEYSKMATKYEKLSEASKKANKKRWNGSGSESDRSPDLIPMRSHSESESESESVHTPEPIFPTVQEVVEYGSMAAAIPKDYCEHYHERSCVLNRWLSRGQLIDWRRDISGSSWWGKDRTTWGKLKGTFANRRTNPSRNEGTANEKQTGAYAGIGKRKV